MKHKDLGHPLVQGLCKGLCAKSFVIEFWIDQWHIGSKFLMVHENATGVGTSVKALKGG